MMPQRGTKLEDAVWKKTVVSPSHDGGNDSDVLKEADVVYDELDLLYLPTSFCRVGPEVALHRQVDSSSSCTSNGSSYSSDVAASHPPPRVTRGAVEEDVADATAVKRSSSSPPPEPLCENSTDVEQSSCSHRMRSSSSPTSSPTVSNPPSAGPSAPCLGSEAPHRGQDIGHGLGMENEPLAPLDAPTRIPALMQEFDGELLDIIKAYYMRKQGHRSTSNMAPLQQQQHQHLQPAESQSLLHPVAAAMPSGPNSGSHVAPPPDHRPTSPSRRLYPFAAPEMPSDPITYSPSDVLAMRGEYDRRLPAYMATGPSTSITPGRGGTATYETLYGRRGGETAAVGASSGVGSSPQLHPAAGPHSSHPPFALSERDGRHFALPPSSAAGAGAGGADGGTETSSSMRGARIFGFSSLPTYSSTSFVRAYVSDISLSLEPAVIVSGLAAALNMVVVSFLQHHVLDTRDHLGVFLIGSYMIFASYYMIYYFLERFSSSFRRIASQDKKFYIIGNLIKAGILVSITPFAVVHLSKIILLDVWEGNILRNLGCIYAIPDFISMVIVRRMRWSTWFHHLCVVIFNYFSILNNYNDENVCRCVVVYAAFSSFAYCVNVLLASRFLGVSANVARLLSFAALVVYAFCCAVNWAWQVYYLRRLLTRGHDHWTVYVYMFLISLVMWDDVVLNRWLLNHARNNAYAAAQHQQHPHHPMQAHRHSQRPLLSHRPSR